MTFRLRSPCNTCAGTQGRALMNKGKVWVFCFICGRRVYAAKNGEVPKECILYKEDAERQLDLLSDRTPQTSAQNGSKA